MKVKIQRIGQALGLSMEAIKRIETILKAHKNKF